MSAKAGTNKLASPGRSAGEIATRAGGSRILRHTYAARFIMLHILAQIQNLDNCTSHTPNNRRKRSPFPILSVQLMLRFACRFSIDEISQFCADALPSILEQNIEKDFAKKPREAVEGVLDTRALKSDGGDVDHSKFCKGCNKILCLVCKMVYLWYSSEA